MRLLYRSSDGTQAWESPSVTDADLAAFLARASVNPAQSHITYWSAMTRGTQSEPGYVVLHDPLLGDRFVATDRLPGQWWRTLVGPRQEDD